VVDFILELAQISDKPVSKDELQTAINDLDTEMTVAVPEVDA
jgi:hypothetical protein